MNSLLLDSGYLLIFLVMYQTPAFHACFGVLNHSEFFISPVFPLVAILRSDVLHMKRQGNELLRAKLEMQNLLSASLNHW